MRSVEVLRRDAMAIWQAGVEAVQSERLINETVSVEGHWLHLGDDTLDLRTTGRIAVVGAGKAGAGMAAGIEAALGPAVAAAKQLHGWINVPEDCLDLEPPLRWLHLHGARPAGRNEPTEAGIDGTREILRIVRSLGPDDLCLTLISGGGSALLPAPIDGVTLADKQAIARHLSSAGADIAELNAVRKPLSAVKGGGLARACRAGRLVSLIISDVLGDPLDVIASGPTAASTSSAADALRVLEKYQARAAGINERVFTALEKLARSGEQHWDPMAGQCEITNLVIGNNAVAVDAAGMAAERLGYSHAMSSSRTLEGPVEPIGRHLAGMAQSMRSRSGPDCLIQGGEGVVQLAPDGERGLGGRNQQLALAALEAWHGAATGMLILSGGTDGEDGPTDAAGAFVDERIQVEAVKLGLNPADYLRRNDAYHFFSQTGGLIKTGPTHTNVCDLRIVLVDREELPLR